MNDHLDATTISAYLDEELQAAERLRVEEHLAGCARCSSQRRSLQATAAAVGQLPREEMTADEHRALRQAILGAPSPSAGRWSLLPLQRWWALAGGLGLVLIAVVGFVALRPPSHQALDQAAAPESAPQLLDFTSGDEVEAAVASLPEVSGRTSGGSAGRDGGDGSRVSGGGGDAGGAAERGAPPPAAPLTAQGSSSADEGAGTGGAAGGEAYAEGRLDAAGSTFSPTNGAVCLDKVREAGPARLEPLAAKEARFRGRPAWLLVFASGPEAPPNDGQGPPRDRLEVWLLAPEDCRGYSGAGLLDRALYHSTFDRP
jgi:hypothetical protein